MDRHWKLKAWILVGLFLGPFLLQSVLGMLWIWEQGWIATTTAALIWVLAGAFFSLLLRRWTDSDRSIIPPLDWETPEAFTPLDKSAWEIVSQEAQAGESLDQQRLMEADGYIDAGRSLMHKLAEHYHPRSANPVDHVPLIELLTALELASEDLARLCRQIPGGDLITLSHWRKAMQAAGYMNKANDVYSYLLPLINPVSGLARLGAREWIVKPAWQTTQANILRWFFEAYVNRLGMHLIELFSGRLASGSLQYRRLTRGAAWAQEAGTPPPRLIIGSLECLQGGNTEIHARIRQALTGQGGEPLDLGLEEPALERLAKARWIDSQGCLLAGEAGSRRARSAHKQALTTAAGADLIFFGLDAASAGDPGVQAFAREWTAFFAEYPHRIPPPILLVAHGLETTPGDPVERSLALARFDALQAIFPLRSVEIVEIRTAQAPADGFRALGQAITRTLPKTERIALLRELRALSERSTLSRLASQLGAAGRLFAANLRRPRHPGERRA